MLKSYSDNDPALSSLSKHKFMGYKFKLLEKAHHGFQEQRLRKNKQSPGVLKECGVQVLC